MKTYEPRPGERISNTCDTLERRTVEHNGPVQANFNGVVITSEVGMTSGDMQQKWQDEMNRRATAYKASPEGVVVERCRGELQRLCDESAKVGIVPFDVVDEAVWVKWRESNEDGGYGEACLRYAARWASIMDAKILDGAKLEEIVDATGHEADTEGISGFMHGAAVSILTGCWRHGEALKQCQT